ncbi:hypothetical protein N8T08_008246 [Aspergillus melleus]|uniref:Uncharacterized protein n=1 Tax=Aspergillus melleus TaxID=138277 RepID=A0ACC3AWK9_9EURO|nr:hypothetical protein N8T08_008246 [Aspergillus melleus]
MVREGMASAFDLNKAALDTMRALQQQTHSEAQMDLFEYMWSFAVKKALTDNNQVSNFAQVDLCAWYLKFLSTSKMKYWSDLGAKSFIAWPVHTVFNMTLLRTKMDALALLDHTLLHELTHAISLLPTDDTSGYLSYDPSPTSNNGTQGPALGVKPTSLSDTRLRVTSLSSSNQEDSATSYTATSSIPNITSPIFSSIQTSTINLPSPITSTQSNFTAEFPMPITVFPISNTETSTSITYIATNTVDSDNQPTDVWKCQGDLCDTSSSKDCIIPAFCVDEPDLGPSWGLCCGFIPLPVPGGAALLPGGPSSPPLIGPPAGGGGGQSGGGSGSGSNSNTDPKNDDQDSDKSKDDDQDEKDTLTSVSTARRSTSLSTTKSSTATSTESTSSDATSSSERSTSTSKSETCSETATVSTCTMATCSTFQPIDSCSLTISTTVTTITGSTTDAIASPIEHYWDWDGQHNWLEVQQSVLEGLETALALPSPGITTTEIASESTASVPASITAVPSTTTSQEPPATAAPSVTTTDPAPIITVITLPTTLVTFNIWRDPQWLCYCPRTTSSSSTTLFVPLITNNLCRYTSIPDPVPSMSISYRPKRFNTD